jgi:hypothetical protein
MRNNRVKKDYGMLDYYKYYLKNNSNVPQSKSKFNKVISEFNKGVVNLIINEGVEFKPTKLQFTFCIRKAKRVPKIKEGKLINTTPIDWKSTNQLWESDNEAKNKKILLRYLNNHTFKYVFRIKVLRFGQNYKNKKYYKYKPARSFQRLLAKRILDNNLDNFDAYKLY